MGTAYTSAATGNWNSSSTWTPTGIPVSGDTVTIASGHTVTVPSGYTAACGTSPTDNSGATALTINGPLVVNGTLVWKGPVKQGNATVTVNGGGTLTYDATLAATPATALYGWEISQADLQANARLVLNGSSGSRVTVNSASTTATPRGFGNLLIGNQNGGRIEATYTDFSYIGSTAVNGGQVCATKLSSNVGLLSFDHCTFDHCGMVYTSNMATAANFVFTFNRITNPINSSFALQLDGTNAATGQRLITNNDIAGVFFVSGTADINGGWTIKHNVCGRVVYSGGSSGQPTFTNGTGGTVWDQNLLFQVSATTSSDPAVTPPNGTLTNSYLFRQVPPSYANGHPVYTKMTGPSLLIDGWVFHYAGVDTDGDMIEPNGGDDASARTYTIQKSIFMPNAAGLACGSFVNNSSTQAQPKTVITFDHNTCALGTAAGSVFGVAAEASGTTWSAGAVASIRSNLGWRATSGTGYWSLPDSATATISNAAVTAADYNNSYNVSNNAYGGPAGMYATTPGAHDLAVNPQFVDSARSLLNFDQGYLGQPVATAWANGTAYNVGDVVSASTSTFYGGATYNFRCAVAHTAATATNKPASGSGWTPYWEPAAVKLIADDVLAGTTYSGGTTSLIGELVAWTKAGFAPQNAALHNTAHDGTDRGAVAFASPATASGLPWLAAYVGSN
jgi:hypothetical protein